ncbi:hypothetical protein CHLRE_12g541950v5 [Chlamydomonas reinhardtii]|uniref:Uncharacterized protein n=1 Tax=Chlamydomonas reinhardtii TaxID=3055 RepID=A0A2K3D6U3_CHLRE|nr:uncharacterized protein CHLRE_12g541950v5 [Chlamydomonas reinhardtii]PNW76252.1 hypothetical protein CHLRE_12g541950v5 [Chlamydomonas reinhardtii]
MQRCGFLRGFRAAALLAAPPAASCSANSFASTAGPHLLPCTGFASTAGPHLQLCTGASRIRTFSSRGDDGRNGDSRGDGLDSSSGNQVEPRVDPFRDCGLRHDSGGGSGGGRQQLLPQAAASAAPVAEQHRLQLSAAGDSASLQDIARIVKEAVRAEFASPGVKRIVKEAVRAEFASQDNTPIVKEVRAEIKSFSQRLESVCDGLSALMEYTAAKQLQQDLGDDVRVHPNVRLTGAKSTSDCLLREADAEVKETAASALVKRLQGLSGLRAVLRYFLTRACADLMGLRKRSASAAAAAATAAMAAAADASAANVAAAAADAATIAISTARDAATIQGHLVTLQALQDRLLVATAGTAVEAHLAAAAVTALGSAQGYIDTHRPRRPRAGHPPESSAASNSTSSGGSGTGAGSRDDEHGDGQDSSSRSGDDDGGDGTQACTPYAAAMLLLDAMRHRKTDELLLLVTDGPFSMLVLSALQPATTLPLTAALNTSSGSGSGGSFKPATHLEVDALAVRLKDSTLQVIIQEAKMTSNLATARKQVARIGTLFAYAYNVAVAAGAFGEGEPPRLRLEAQIVFARLKALPPAQLEQMVELVPAEGERHMMRVRVTGLAGCAINP